MPWFTKLGFVFQFPCCTEKDQIMFHSTMALPLLLIAVSSNLAMAIKKEKRAPQTLSRGNVYFILCSYLLILPCRSGNFFI